MSLRGNLIKIWLYSNKESTKMRNTNRTTTFHKTQRKLKNNSTLSWILFSCHRFSAPLISASNMKRTTVLIVPSCRNWGHDSFFRDRLSRCFVF